jgi:ectoine hydroxylase-related dioxygenase (phytanoyl-CoA dioxygenase family)
MSSTSYGLTHTAAPEELAMEEFRINGFTVVETGLSSQELSYARSSLDGIYHEQEQSFGRDRMKAIKELDVVRCPFVYDDFFLRRVVMNPAVNAFMRFQLGDYYILHLQNGIINRPDRGHHQSSWHRDLPYQNYVVSRPIAIGVLFCIDPFSAENGGTVVLPHSHRVEDAPSEEFMTKHQVQLSAASGKAIVFNAMLLHRAGVNTSRQARRAVNNVFTVPIIRQQIDLPRLLQGKYADDPGLRKLLGYESQSQGSVNEYRASRLERIRK